MGEWKKAESRKILIADDEKDKISDLVKLLEGENFRVTVKDSVQCAINEINERGEIYEIIILDVMFFLHESSSREGYNAASAGVNDILPIIKENGFPVIIYSAIPEEMVFPMRKDDCKDIADEQHKDLESLERGYKKWLQKSVLPTQVLDIIEEMHIVKPNKKQGI